jgi:hypothetical protein
MCPACLATISMIVAGVISTGGATALAVKTLGRRKASEGASAAVNSGQAEFRQSNEKEKQS